MTMIKEIKRPPLSKPSPSALDPREFRQVLGTFTTGVTVITARGQDNTLAGVTANSFNSVSMDPPLVLWSLARKSNSLDTFASAEHWAVHILAHDQDNISSHFARSVSGQEKFADINYENGLDNTPLLSGCTARLQCRTKNIYDGGDHIILVGEVITYDKCDTPPLVFQKGSYAIATNTSQTIEPPAGEDLRNSSDKSPIGYLLATAYLNFSAKTKAQAEKLNLNGAEYLILSALGTREGRTYHEIITLAGYAGTNVGPEAINDLVARGYIQIFDKEDSLSPEDDHAKIGLTPDGRLAVEKIFKESELVEAEIMQKLGTPEAIALRYLLSKFVKTYSPSIPYRWF
ncbi:flavin reductase [Pseudomonas sp. 5P_3.1_Bac2]|uniref:flavin reductase n=1 Tax=Pseudomonas sp. 5P_3.1_Bac2 TaxID=2971617 RepID=UPI0021C8C625|nr:flavin reductase [Pseudomonas sp. 5P_3.1_Bac2]MCU1718070.1 flavin reductase [Pseudomonas sp. 5P_3.1_Bac2]